MADFFVLALLSSVESRKHQQLLMELYEKYYPLVLKRISTSVQNREDIQDCIQDCFVKLAGNIAVLEGLLPKQITVYVLTTVRSVMIDFKCKKNLLQTEELTEDFKEGIASSPVEELIEAREGIRRFIDHFDRLSELDQILLQSVFYEGISYPVLAKKLGIKESSLRVYVHRAKKNALKLMEGEGIYG